MAGQFQQFKEGYYKATIVKVTLGEANSGNPQIVFAVKPFELTGDPDFPVPDVERSVFRSLTDKTIDYAINDLAALGYDRDGFAEVDSSHPDAFPFAGMEVKVKLHYEEYEGKTREKWNLALGGGFAVKPMEKKAVSLLDARWGSLFKAKRAAAGGAAPRTSIRVPPAAAAAAKPGEDGEIAF